MRANRLQAVRTRAARPPRAGRRDALRERPRAKREHADRGCGHGRRARAARSARGVRITPSGPAPPRLPRGGGPRRPLASENPEFVAIFFDYLSFRARFRAFEAPLPPSQTMSEILSVALTWVFTKQCLRLGAARRRKTSKNRKKIATKPDPADARPRSAPERDREGASIVASGRPSAPGARRAGATGRAASAQRRARTRNPQKSASGGSGRERPPTRLARGCPSGRSSCRTPAGRPAYGRKPRRVRGVRRGRARQPLAAIGAGSARPAPSWPSAGPMSARQSMANGWALRRLCAMRARRGRRARGARRTEKARIVARISTSAARPKR